MTRAEFGDSGGDRRNGRLHDPMLRGHCQVAELSTRRRQRCVAECRPREVGKEIQAEANAASRRHHRRCPSRAGRCPHSKAQGQACANGKRRAVDYTVISATQVPRQIAVVAVMSKPHRCPHIAMTGNICVFVALRTRLWRSNYEKILPWWSGQRLRILYPVLYRLRTYQYACDPGAIRSVRAKSRASGAASRPGALRR
jgi:hypothetical protein